MPCGVGQRRVERDAVRPLGQVLADDDHAGGAVEELAVGADGGPRPREPPRRHAPERGVDGPEAAHDLERVSAHEAARAVGLVELLAHDAAARRPLVAVEGLVEDAGHHRVRVEHQVLADEPAAVGEAVGEVRERSSGAGAACRCRCRPAPRPPPSAGCSTAVGVVVDDAVRHAVAPTVISRTRQPVRSVHALGACAAGQ